MIFVEPPHSQYDLHFRLFGIPVRIHPLFWLVSLLMAAPTPGGGRNIDPLQMLIWVAVVFVSILVHEMGHALAALMHGWPPRITLYGFGGLASYQPTYRSTRSQVLIFAAGPGAGFLFIALIMAVVNATGHHVTFERANLLPLWVFFDEFANQNVNVLIRDLLWVNIFWGLMNLLPIFPLDGGRIAQELMMQANPVEGLQKSLGLSIFAAIIAGVFCGIKFQSFCMVLFFGYLAYNSYSVLQQLRGRGGGFGPW